MPLLHHNTRMILFPSLFDFSGCKKNWFLFRKNEQEKIWGKENFSKELRYYGWYWVSKVLDE